MKYIQSNKQGTNLSLRELSQVLVAVNDLNFPATHRTSTSGAPQTIPPMGISKEAIIHACAEVQRVNSHCLL